MNKKKAKQLCETLVVGVVSQEEITRRKGIPVMNLEERLILAESCKWADEVIPNVPYDPTLALLDQLNCSHCGHGDDIIVKEDGTNVYQDFINANRFL
jgi:ethanolamine-phosphate cytidylyltransferase